MFENLTARLQEAFKRLRSKGKLTEKDVEEALREVRLALLEADVNFKVVKDFIARVKEKAIGQDVLSSLTPAQQVIKIVFEELTNLMGGGESKISFASNRPTILMLVGLQGSGKTTTVAKLARLFKAQGKRPLMVACDTQRPAAITQLQILGERLNIPVFSMGDKIDPVNIARASLAKAKDMACDVLLIDTAGRLHIDEELMGQLVEMKRAVAPDEVLLVVDAMTGQDALNLAKTFNEAVGVDGVILTKLDGDARGGAALSCRAVTSKPIKFVSVGEKLDALESFHPDRMASRILGMGDIESLLEKAQAAIDAESSRRLVQKAVSKEFGLDDFVDQLNQVRRMGPLDQLLAMIPGFGTSKALKDLKVDEKQLNRIEAIVSSMTPQERRNPAIIDGSRRRRIARGSGVSVQDVNSLLRQFEQVRKLMRQVGEIEKAAKRGLPMGFPFFK